MVYMGDRWANGVRPCFKFKVKDKINGSGAGERRAMPVSLVEDNLPNVLIFMDLRVAFRVVAIARQSALRAPLFCVLKAVKKGARALP